MRLNKLGPLLISLISLIILTFSSSAWSDTPRMSQEKLLNQLDSDAVIIIDVRTGGDWEDSDIKIKGAIRENPKKLESWIGKYPKDKTLVLYCA